MSTEHNLEANSGQSEPMPLFSGLTHREAMRQVAELNSAGQTVGCWRPEGEELYSIFSFDATIGQIARELKGKMG